MKVLNVNVLLDPILGGGTAERTFQMSKALTKSDIDCTILTTDIGITDARIGSLENIQVIKLRCLVQRFFIVYFSWKHLKGVVSNADIIHLMGHWSLLNILVYFLAKKTGTPYVICPAGELSLFGRSKPIKRLFNLFIGHKIVKDAAGYIAVTQDEFSVYEQYGIKNELVTIIPNGVNESDFLLTQSDTNILEQFNISNSSPIILFMGRLNLIKGPDILLEAFYNVSQKYPDYQLVFAGPDGGELSALKQFAIDRNINDRVHFIGFVSGSDKAYLYQRAEFLIIPSRMEAMSIVVLEAGICGTPVLITNKCGFNEVANINGGEVVEATVTGLSDGLVKMFNRKEILGKLGLNLKAFVFEYYTWDMISRHYIDLYNQILSKK